LGKVYDAALKQLVDAFAGDWMAWLGPRLGLPPETVYEPLDADLSTVSPQADKLFRLSGPAGGIVHLELQTGWEDRLADRLLVYNVLAEYRHGGPVQTVLMLLRREANTPALTGELRRTAAGQVYLEFRYTVIRTWELRADDLLSGPAGTLPLATITDDAQAVLPDVVARLGGRISREVIDPTARETLWAAAYILLGLRHDEETINRLFQGLKTMEESSTYQYILRRGEAKGRAVEARRVLGLLGEQRFGPPPAAVDSALDGISDPDRLERIVARLLQASDWADLLATP
jgi:predicted transposase YdaD